MIGVSQVVSERCSACGGSDDVVRVAMAPRDQATMSFRLCRSCARDLREHLAAFDRQRVSRSS